jgi:signal transduction histidine kinase
VRQLRAVLEAYAVVEARLPPDAQAALKAAKEAADYAYVAEDLPQLVEQTREGIGRVRTIVRDLKDYSRSDDADWRYASLSGIIESTLNLAKNEFKYHCTVHKRYAELPDVWCLPPRLGQVFMNLVVNAAQAIEGKGDITLSTARVDERTASVSVTDTGKGIPPEVLPRIFEPFYTTKPAGKGTGLGLPTVQQIVERHGGRIDVVSEVGKGTTFTVTLPIGPRS